MRLFLRALLKTSSIFLVKMNENDPQSEFIRGIGMLIFVEIAAVTVLAIDWSTRDAIKENAKIDAKYDEKRLGMIRNDISELYWKLRDYREVNKER